jgi:hypothetical protein
LVKNIDLAVQRGATEKSGAPSIRQIDGNDLKI